MRSLQTDGSFIDQGLSPSPHNSKARILRNGLSVSAFALLENYLKDRIGEVTAELAKTSIRFDDFSVELQSFFSIKAVQGFAKQLNFAEKSDKLNFAKQNISSLAKIFGAPVEYTNFGFSPTGSNVKSDDIKDLPSLFGGPAGWPELQLICKEVGISRMNLSNDLNNFSRARNAGAHDIMTNVASTDLETHLETSLVLGLSCDISITNSVAWICSSKSFTQATASNLTNRPVYKFVRENPDSTWSEWSVGGKRVIKTYPSFELSRAGCLGRKSGHYHTVAIDKFSKPIYII
ncbi:hypothetical protein FV230_00175 [Methylobacterium sp. WL6]|nr:hypothetical protein FV230_00175 [Methylobacterium sp. WL6]